MTLYTTNRAAISLLLLLMFFSSFASAQKIDSLLSILKKHTTEDTTKVKLYAEASMAYKFTNPDSIIFYANKGLSLANELRFERGKAQCLICLSVASIIRNELDKSLRYCDEAIVIAEKNARHLLNAAFFYKATICYNQTKYNEAILFYKKSAELDEKANDLGEAANSLNNIGNCYSAIGNYPEALNYFLKGLKIREKTNDKSEIAISLGNIGQVYADMKEYKKAINYVHQSIAMQEKDHNPTSLMLNYENAGGVYAAMNDYQNAIDAFNTALHISDSAKIGGSRSTLYVNLGEVYIEMKEYDKAYESYQKCLSDPELSNNPASEAMTHRGLGRILIHKGNVKEGIPHLLKAQEMFKVNEMLPQFTENADELSKAYTKAGDYEHALKYTNMYYNFRDSINNKKNDLKVQQLQFDYELQKKQTQIELLNKNKVISQISMWSLATGILLLSVIIIVLYRSRQLEKSSKELIATQVKKLDELNNYKDKIFSVLSHDLSGPINSLSMIMSMLNDKAISKEDFQDLQIDVDKQLNSVTFLLDNLLKWSKNYLTGGKILKQEPLKIKSIAEQNISLIQNVADRKKITLRNDIPDGIIAFADAGQVDIVIRNLISNALKFTSHGGSVQLAAKEDGNRVKITITDTGVGMNEEQLKNLFNHTPDNSTYGTAGEKGIGLGLMLCYEFIIANNGTISATSELNKGSTFTIDLPKG